MRKVILAILSLVLVAVPVCYAAPQQESAAEAARKAREQKKNQPKAAKVFTNDDLVAARGGVSVVGSAPAPDKPAAEQPVPGEKKTPAAEDKEEKPKKDEAYWRRRFAEARGKLRTAEKELDVVQRELNLQQQQYYSDPNKALRQQYDRSDINNLRKAIEDKRAEVEKLRQALAELEDELRREGGDPGWARES